MKTHHLITALLGLLILTPLARADEADIHLTIAPGTDHHIKRVVAVARVKAPLEQVWHKVIDYTQYGATSKTLKVTYVDPREIDQREVRLSVDLPLPGPKMDCAFYFAKDDTHHVLSWMRKENCFKTNTGSISLEADGDQTLLTFTADLEIGKIIPNWVFAWAVKKNIPAEINRIRDDSKLALASAQ